MFADSVQLPLPSRELVSFGEPFVLRRTWRARAKGLTSRRTGGRNRFGKEGVSPEAHTRCVREIAAARIATGGRIE